MALHWAWSFGLAGSKQNYSDSGWYLSGTVDLNSSASPLPRQPEGGVGGMLKGCRLTANQSFNTPNFLAGTLSDGQIQIHWYCSAIHTSTRILGVRSASGTLLCEIRPTASSSPTTLNVYSGEGTMTLRGTTTGTVSAGQWYVIALRFKTGTSGGEIAISINGSVETLVSTGNVGATSDWVSFYTYSYNTYNCITGITVWDDGPNDDALTVTRWTGTMRAVSDSADGAWTNESASATDLYLSTREDPLDPDNTYCQTTTDPDEVRFGVDTTDATYGFGSSWFPDTIDGIVVEAAMRGDGGLVTGTPVIDDGANNLQGTGQVLDSESGCMGQVFTTQADGSSGWDAAALDGHTYGAEVS